MDKKILFEIKKFEIKNKRENPLKPLPVSVFFSDRTKTPDIENTIRSLPKNSTIIIREYDLDIKTREDFAQNISFLARRLGLKVIVGKDILLAKKIKADGVHFSDFDHLPINLLQKDKFPKNFILSFSCHSLKSLLAAQKLKPDIIFISPIFPTQSHINIPALGIKSLAKFYYQIRNNLYDTPPIYALGGITKANLPSIRKIGLSGFAAISLFLEN
jgi:thiamine-phosphate pyrophosphorylase